MTRKRSAYLKAIQFDNSLPIEKEAMDLWLKDLDNPFRWTLRPILQLFFAVLLHLIWFLKRLPLPQFSAPRFLQYLICWFCKYFVSYEANLLILRHFTTESNLLNFMAVNSGLSEVELVNLYPQKIEDMKEHSFVKHDQELFRLFAELGYWQPREEPLAEEKVNWDYWKPLQNRDFEVKKRFSQILDFESAHSLFMCIFCLLLKKDEYRDAINGFNLDQSIAIRIAQIIGKPEIIEMAYNRFPHYLIGPWNLTQRFLMHGFFTEYAYTYLEEKRKKSKLQ